MYKVEFLLLKLKKNKKTFNNYCDNVKLLNILKYLYI